MKITVDGYELDDEQMDIVLNDEKNILVVAGAGSGKTTTIVGKIKYLIQKKGFKSNEIICVTFTNAASKSLENKIKKELGIDINTYTFHKLSMKILNDINYSLCDDNLIDNVVNKFFDIDILNNLNYMKMILKYFNIYNKNIKKSYYNLIDSIEIKRLKKIIITFIHLFKCNGYELNDFNKFLLKIKKLSNIFYYKREKLFLIIALNIYLIYEKYLEDNKELDFDDLIIKATSYLDNYNIGDLKYIIIDEYQDTSYIRFLLIKKIIDKTKAKLMVVGDDYQSIYRFTGCDISLFIDFKKYFNDSLIKKIQTTYRNSGDLINIAGKFIMRNKRQIKKIMMSNKNIDNPIKIIIYSDFKKSFRSVLDDIVSINNGSIMVIGRNNKDIEMILDNDFKLKEDRIINSKYNVDIKYMTVHKSKGLEADNVIIINLSDDYLGFPSKIHDDKILRLVTTNNDNYLYGEERRLFYVALTRTKNRVYLMSPKGNISCFVKELKMYGIRYN